MKEIIKIKGEIQEMGNKLGKRLISWETNVQNRESTKLSCLTSCISVTQRAFGQS